MKSYWFRIFRSRRRRRTTVRSTSVLFKRYSMFEGLELRSMLSGDGLGDSVLVADDIHATPLEELSITQLMSSYLAENSGAPSADPLAASDPVANPLVEGIVGQVTLKFTDLEGNEITQITVGQDFKVEVYVDDQRAPADPEFRGFFAAFVGVNFNTSLVTLEDGEAVVVDDFFDFLDTVDTSTPGSIVAGGTSNEGEGPGSDPQLLFTATMKAVSAGTANFAPAFYSSEDDPWLMYTLDPNDEIVASNITFTAASLTINGPPSLSIGDVTQAEGDTNQNFFFTVTLSEPATENITVQYTTQPGTASGTNPGQDFVPQSGTLTFEQGITSKVITISVIGDTTSESDETFTVVLSNPTGAILDDATGLGTIEDDDQPIVSVANVSQDEGNAEGTLVFEVTLSKAPTGEVTVAYTTADDTAVAASDYVAQSGTLTFAAGETTRSITVTVNGDTVDEENEAFKLLLSNPVGAVFGDSDEATGTLINDDGPVLSLIPGAISQTEGDENSSMVFTVKLNQAASENVVVVYNTQDGTATAGSDYTATSGTFTFTPGVTEQLITVSLLGDNLDEADETFSLVLSAPQNATIASSTSVGTILDDDGPAITMSGPSSVNENSGAYLITVKLASASNQQVTVVYNTADGTANSASDYAAQSGTLTFAPSETQKIITVALSGDTTKEPNETFTINLTNAVNAEIGDASFTATIANDDDVPTVEVVAPSPQNEGNSGGTPFVFTVKLSGASTDTITVAYNTASLIAQAGSDFTATSGTLTFAPGQTSQLVTVLVTGDTLVEDSSETFRLDLSSPSGATIKTGGGSATAVIQNDDTAPLISISDASVAEGDSGTSQMVFTVTLTNPSLQTVTVRYTTEDMTAFSNGDYTATSGTLTFAPNETQKLITINVVGDNFNEENETFRVLLSNPTNSTIGDAAGIGTIQDESTDSINIVPSTISGKVFIDGDGSGTQTGLEKSLAGVTVNLTGAATMSTTTNATGAYSFGNLQPGTYTVKFVMPGQYKTGAAVLGNDGGSAISDGFTFTIENPGGVTANDYHFTTKGLKSAFLSMRSFISSNLASTSESVGQVSVSITTVTNPINLGNAATTSISGTGTVGANVSVVASSGGTSTAPYTATVGANGTWTISGINVTTLPDGTVTYTATATENGTTSSDTITASKDTVAPMVDVTTVTNPVNSSNASATTASGTGTVGATVSVTVTDGTTTTAAKTAVVDSNGDWSVSGINVSSLANGTITYNVSISDAGGNTATDSITSTKDTEAPALDITDAPSVINAAGDENVSISGTASPNTTITVTILGPDSGSVGPLSTQSDASGNWSITGINLTALDDGAITFSVTATDGANNTTTVTENATKDTVTNIEIADATDPINLSNVASASVSGTAEAGAMVVVVISLGEDEITINDIAVDAQGNWSATGIDLSELGDGTVTYTVTVTDDAGNTAEDTLEALKDTEAPTVEVTDVTSPIDMSNYDAVELSGTGEIGSTVSVVVSDGTTNLTVTQTAVVDGDGNWTIDGIDVSSLDDGTLVFTVTATDDAGNTADDTIESVKTTVAVDEVTGPVTQANQTAVSISGTGQIGADIEVIVSIGDQQTSAYTTEIDTNGDWSITGIDVSALADGELTFTVTASVGEREVSVTTTATKDTVAEGSILEGTSPINAANQANVSLNGTAELDATVTVSITDGDATIADVAAAAEAGIWAISGIDVSGLAEGTITYIVKVTDALGNVTEYELDVLKDTLAPSLEVEDVASPIGIAGQGSVSVSGTSDPGATVSVVVSIGEQETVAYDTVADENGDWTITGIDVSSLADGTLLFTVTATDAAGNDTVDASQTAEKQTLAVDAIEDTITQLNQSMVTITGTSDPDATVTVVASNGDQVLAGVAATVDELGNWTAVINVTTLADGTLSFKVTAAVGEDSVEQTVTGDKDTVADAEILAGTTVVNAENETAASINGMTAADSTVELTIVGGEEGSEVTIGPISLTVNGDGTWSLSDIDLSSLPEGDFTYKISVTDSLGNVNAYELAGNKDTIAPMLEILSVTDPIELADVANVMISGTGEPGSTISVVITDGGNMTEPQTAIVDSEGNWSITGIDVSGLEDGGITFEVSAEDAAGNVTNDSWEAEKSTVEIIGATLLVTQENVTEVSVNGTAQIGSSVVVAASDGTDQVTSSAVIIDDSGTWTVMFDLTTLADGAITITATATDGEFSAVDTDTIQKDTVADGEILSATDPVNSLNVALATVGGTAEVGSTAELRVIGGEEGSEVALGPISVTVAGDGTWSIADLDLSTLPDGPIRYELVVTDAAGNMATDQWLATKDVLPPDVDALTVPSVINAAGAESVEVTGTADAGATIVVEATDGTGTVTSTAVLADSEGEWAVTLDVSSLDDGTITFNVTATDAAGNENADAINADKDTVTQVTINPNVSEVTVTAENEGAITVFGTRELNASVDITVSDGVNQVTASVAAAAVTGWLKTLDLSTLDDGTLTISVIATDAAGNTATASVEIQKDTAEPAEPLAMTTSGDDSGEESLFGEDDEWVYDFD